MRVLFVSPRESWPAVSGQRIRDFHFAQALASRFELTYLFFSRAPAASEMQQRLPQAARVVPVQEPPSDVLLSSAKALFHRQPLPVQNCTSSGMAAAIESMLREQTFDIVHLDSIHLAGYLPLIRRLAPEARVVIDWHNIESELMRRYALRAGSFLRRWYAHLTARALKRLEATVLEECFGHIVCSQREYRELIGLHPQARVAVVENGIDSAALSSVPHADPVPQRLIFVGQMSYYANVEGINWFVRHIWPAVRQRFPQMELSIVGSDPSPAVTALQSVQQRIAVTGTVPDVLPYYSGALAAIVPLRTGGGTRLKILEAMAARTPVISTALGAEGIRVTDGSDILLVGGGVGSWLAAIDIVAGAKRAGLIDCAQRLVASEYDWSIVGARLAALFVEWQRRN